MKPSEQLENLKVTIKTLQNLPEHDTESFRIVILNLKQKKAILEKEGANSQR